MWVRTVEHNLERKSVHCNFCCRLCRVHQPLPPHLSWSVWLVTMALSDSFFSLCRDWNLPMCLPVSADERQRGGGGEGPKKDDIKNCGLLPIYVFPLQRTHKFFLYFFTSATRKC
jgi:hypothetical protein